MTNESVILKLSRPQYDVLTSTAERTLNLAGQGSGKTFIIGLLSYYFVSEIPAAVGMIAANTFGQLSDSTLVETFKVWKNFGWTEYSTSNPSGCYIIDKKPPDHFKSHGYTFKSNNNKIFFWNGAVIMTASLDNYKAIEGRTIAWAVLDETADTKEEAVKEVITARLRQDAVYISKNPSTLFHYVAKDHTDASERRNPLYTFTKPTKEQWLTEYYQLEQYRQDILSTIFNPGEYFRKDFDNKRVVICSTHFNERNLPPDYIKNRKKDLSSDQISLLIYGSPFGKTGSEYYNDFQKTKHVVPVQFTPGLPLHIAWDFNVNPYMTMLVWQIVPHESGKICVNCIKEYTLPNPDNTIESICDIFTYDFGHLCSAGLYFYGDATGKNKLPIETVRDYFSVITKMLYDFLSQNSRRLLKQNPRHRAVGKGSLGRRDFMNAVLRGRHNLVIQIDPSCRNTIADFEFVKEDKNGAKVKEKAEINGVVCEKYGHCSDAADGFFAWNWGDWAKE